MIEHIHDCDHAQCDEVAQTIHWCDERIQDDCVYGCTEEEDHDELMGRDDYKDYGD